MGISGPLTNQRPRLNSNAQPWLPCAVPPGLECEMKPDEFTDQPGSYLQYENLACYPAQCMPLPVEDHFMDQSVQIVSAMASAMGKIPNVPVSVYVMRERRGWSMVARVHKKNSMHAETIIGYGKDTILRMLSLSTGIYLLGCRTDPFKTKQHGFVAVLALMQDPGQACWDMYATGQCSRATHCRWQHPVRKQRIYVAVKSLSEDGECLVNSALRAALERFRPECPDKGDSEENSSAVVDENNSTVADEHSVSDEHHMTGA